MLELLTARRATGWAYDSEYPLAPLLVRARDGQNILAQMELEAQTSSVSSSRPDRPGQVFTLPFPSAFDEGKLFRMTVEIAPRDGGDWYPLPRFVKIWNSRLEMPEPANFGPGAVSLKQPATAKDEAFFSCTRASSVHDASEARPLFVLGAARSGTTAFCLALEKGTRYKGFPEGHVLDIAIRLANSISAHFEKKEQWMSKDDITSYQIGHVALRRFQQLTIEMLHSLAAGYITPFWFDKTPTYQMIASVPILAEAWPNSRFVFMKRRGLENVCSRLRKFPRSDFVANSKDWALIMAGWRSVRDTVAGRYIEIDQLTLATDPETTAASVGELLALDPSEIAEFADRLRRHRPEATGASKSTVIDGLDGTGWSQEQIDIFRENCAAEMEAYGYTYDSTYHTTYHSGRPVTPS